MKMQRIQDNLNLKSLLKGICKVLMIINKMLMRTGKLQLRTITNSLESIMSKVITCFHLIFQRGIKKKVHREIT